MIRAMAASIVALWCASKKLRLLTVTASSAAVSGRALKSSEAARTPPSFPRLANRDGDDDDHSPCDQPLAVFEAHQQEPVVDDADHQRSDNGADDRSCATEQARPAEHCGRDDRELVAFAELEAPGVEAAGIEHPRDCRPEARNDEHPHLDAAGVDAAIAGCGLAAAGRQDAAPEGRAAKDDMPDDRDDQGPDDQYRDRSQVSAAEQPDEVVVED